MKMDEDVDIVLPKFRPVATWEMNGTPFNMYIDVFRKLNESSKNVTDELARLLFIIMGIEYGAPGVLWVTNELKLPNIFIFSSKD
jgi:hypothetical protein